MKDEDNKRKKVFVTQRVHEETLAILKEHFEVIENPTSEPFSYEQYREHLVETDALLAFMPDKVDADLLDCAPKLKLISAALKGFDNFDLDEISRRNINFTHIPDLLSEPTAEIGLTLTLALFRNVIPGHIRVESESFHGWRPILYGKTLFRARIGLIGMGKVAQALLPLLSGFGCHIQYYDPTRRMDLEEKYSNLHYISKENVHKNVDVLYPLMSLNTETKYWVNKDLISEMEVSASIVNVGRGSLVSEKDILEALMQNKLYGYAADVFEMEDWAIKSRPNRIEPDLLSHPRTVFSPHLGSAVDKVRCEISNEAARKIVRFFKS